MNIPSTIADYLRCCSQELGERILKVYPALQAPGDPLSDRFNSLLRSPFAAQRLAAMGVVKRWERAKAAAVIAECGTGKTLMALSALHVHSGGRPYTALVMAPRISSESGAERFSLRSPAHASSRLMACGLRGGRAPFRME